MRNRRVADVMTADVITVGRESTFKDIVATMAGHGVTAVPVIDATGHVLGMVTETDLLRKIEYSTRGAFVPLFERRGRRVARHKAEAVTAERLMTAPAVTVSADATLTEAARHMSRDGVRRMPVTDEHGAVSGIVSRGDLIRVFGRPDEEIGADVAEEVLRRAMSIDPSTMRIGVRDGVVDIGGTLERRSLIPIVVELVRAVDGVVDVVPRLTYTSDDTYPTTFIGA